MVEFYRDTKSISLWTTITSMRDQMSRHPTHSPLVLNTSFLFVAVFCRCFVSERTVNAAAGFSPAGGVCAQGAQVVYLTSRPIVLAPKTRTFLMATEQEGKKLPLGPLLCCLEKVRGVLWREVRC